MAIEPAALALTLNVSNEAIAMCHEVDVIDLHIDTFIPMRLWGYDINKSHTLGVLRGSYMGHLDLPRIEEGGLSAAMWSVTTNPFRTRKGRWSIAHKNFSKLRSAFAGTNSRIRVVSTCADYQQAQRDGVHAAFLSIQGGNSMDAASGDSLLPDPDIVRVTLIHLTNSELGRSSMPFQVRRAQGLTDKGRELIQSLNMCRVFVDLAHISKEGFWEAIKVHDPSQPILVTHTGVSHVTPHWRNIDDDQIRAIAATGGVVGVMFHTMFLRQKGVTGTSMVVNHVEHIINTVGEDFAAIGSDYDGMITPPRELRSGNSYARLVQEMLNRGWSHARIEKVLGGNYLRALRELRG